MTSWMKNQLTKLYNAVPAPVTATQEALAERLRIIIIIITFILLKKK